MFVREAPKVDSLLAELSADPGKLAKVLAANLDDSRYLHWDELHRRKSAAGFTHEEHWLSLRLRRLVNRRAVDLVAAREASNFSFTTPDQLLSNLHQIDHRCGGSVALGTRALNPSRAEQSYLHSAKIEEAIRSSQLEGASTSRSAAKQLLSSGSRPVDRSEQMIVNNHRALEFIRAEIGGKLTPAKVIELQRILTESTIDLPDLPGRLQTIDEERVAVFDRASKRIVHRPPPAEELPDRLKRMCDFANAETSLTESKSFVHPVVRSIILHFWLAYDHPFIDGNGRTARALFYWSMQKNGYWLTEYLSISRRIRSAPAQYQRAFLFCETDSFDLTYFLLHQTKTILDAVDDLELWIVHQESQLKDAERRLKGSGLNYRQRALVGRMMRDEGTRISISSYADETGVTHETARLDLKRLVELGYVEVARDGRRLIYVVASTPPIHFPSNG